MRRRDRVRIGLGIALAFGLVVTACAGADPGAVTTSSSIVRPITTTTRPTTTTTTTRPTTTTTTTRPTTTTTMTPPPPIAAWDGEGVRAVALDHITWKSTEMPDPFPELSESEGVFEFSMNRMEDVPERLLGQMGIVVGDTAAAVLTFDIDIGHPSATYETVGRCYSGATVSGTVTLNDPLHPPLEVQDSFTIPPFQTISACEKEPDALIEHWEAFEAVLIGTFTEIWQESAVPMLLEIMSRQFQGLLYKQVAAIDAFESIDDEAIGAADTVVFLEAVIDLVDYLVKTEDRERDDHIRAGAAAGRLLVAYAGTDYGIGTIDDVEEWREWLATWDAH